MKSLPKLISLLLLVCGFLLISAQEGSFELKIKENEDKLSRIKKELKFVKSKKDSIDKQKSRTLLTLNRMEEEIYLTNLLIKQLNEKDALLTLKIENLEIEIDSLEDELIIRKGILKERVKDIYKKGKVHTFEVLFTSKSFTELTSRMKYLTMIAEQDKKLYDKVKQTQAALEFRITDIGKSRDQLFLVRTEAENEKQTITVEKDNKRQFLNELSGESEKQKKLEDELKKSEESLQYLVNKLRVANKQIEKKRDVKEGTHYFDVSKKKVIWPASGKVISKFGTVRHPKYQTKTLNNGIDISVKIGDPVYAVYDGDVIYADKFLGYGNVIMIDHGNGYFTLYAHLSQMDVIINQPVAMGEIVGKCGDTGSLDGPMLHFEIRKDGKPSNPLDFLK